MYWGAMLVLSGLPILVGIFILSRFVVHVRKGSQRKNWSSITGEIIFSEIHEVTSYTVDSVTNFYPVVRYRYKVNLVEYESDIISASEAPFAIGNEKYAKSQVNKYQVHNKVNVFYNPDNPGEAVLNNSGASRSGMLLLLILGIVLLACGLMPLIYVFFNS